MEIFSSRWLQHWNDLQNWLSERPKELLPVETINDKPFLRILFVHFAAIPSNQLYHTAAILLLKMIPKGIKLPRSPYTSPLWHARRICGISLTNPHQGCLNYALQPLWIAGRFFSHPSEHKQITELIRDIEIETGWGMSWRIRDLETAWVLIQLKNGIRTIAPCRVEHTDHLHTRSHFQASSMMDQPSRKSTRYDTISHPVILVMRLKPRSISCC
jgi:hypothetical protein